jgi:hypothetical protein
MEPPRLRVADDADLAPANADDQPPFALELLE